MHYYFYYSAMNAANLLPFYNLHLTTAAWYGTGYLTALLMINWCSRCLHGGSADAHIFDADIDVFELIKSLNTETAIVF